MRHASALVTVAHGTRDQVGNETGRSITAAVGGRLDLPAEAAYVELSEPLFGDVMARADRPTVVVPLLLSTGFHLRQDLPEAVSRAQVPVALGGSLGPDALLARAQVDRLVAAGARRGQRVVLVAAGSSDVDATCDQMGAVSLLARAWDGPVVLATLSGHGERPADVIRPDDAVSPYLLSPGYFGDRVRREAPAGAVVAEVIGAHDCVVELVCRRARELAASL